MRLKEKGFTLLELIPVLLILALVMVSVGHVLDFGVDINKKQTIQTKVQGEIRETYTNLADDIRKGVSFIDTDNIQDEPSYNNLYIEYDSASQEIYNITHEHYEGYTGIIFIQQINGNYCLYAIKDKELHRFIFTRPVLTLQAESTPSTIDSLTMQYYFANYQFDYFSHTNTASDFYYYQGQNYFECKRPIDSANNYDVYKLNRLNAELSSPTDEVIANDVDNISITDEINTYKITMTIAKENPMNGIPYSKTITSDIAIMNYGGGEDE